MTENHCQPDLDKIYARLKALGFIIDVRGPFPTVIRGLIAERFEMSLPQVIIELSMRHGLGDR